MKGDIWDWDYEKAELKPLKSNTPFMVANLQMGP